MYSDLTSMVKTYLFGSVNVNSLKMGRVWEESLT